MTDAEASPPAGGGAGEALLRPVRGGNTFEETVQRVLQMIKLGVALPGERLPPERELAARLAVSRDTLREALGSLAEAGYLVSRRGRYGGTFVAEELPAIMAGHPASAAASAPVTFDAAAIDDVLGLREILEVGAARLAASRELAAADRERLWQHLEELDGAAGDDYRRLDSRLHLTIAELAGLPSLVPLIAESRMRVNTLLDEIPLMPRNISHADEQHHEIVVAILSGRADAAARLMSEHVAASAALLRGFLG